jgi:hypothetical protein
MAALMLEIKTSGASEGNAKLKKKVSKGSPTARASTASLHFQWKNSTSSHPMVFGYVYIYVHIHPYISMYPYIWIYNITGYGHICTVT